jgi:hypothetical protein
LKYVASHHADQGRQTKKTNIKTALSSSVHNLGEQAPAAMSQLVFQPPVFVMPCNAQCVSQGFRAHVPKFTLRTEVFIILSFYVQLNKTCSHFIRLPRTSKKVLIRTRLSSVIYDTKTTGTNEI